MATNYPGSLDTFSNPSATDDMDDAGFEHDVQHSDANDAIEALEAKLGIGSADPSVAAYFSVLTTRNDGSGGYETVWADMIFPDGSVATPSIRFDGDTDTGFYLPAAGEIGVAVAGTRVASVTGSLTVLDQPVQLPDGDLGDLSLRFAGSTNTGIYLDGVNMGFMADGVVRFKVEDDRASSEGPLDVVESGSASAPSINLFNDNSGLYMADFFPSAVGITAAGVEVARFVDGVGFQIAVDGSADAPALAFTSDPGTGFRATGGGTQWDFASGGTDYIRLSADGISMLDGDISLNPGSQVLASEGSAGAPGLSFARGAGVTGFFYDHANLRVVGSIDSTEVFHFDGDGIKVEDGTEAAPSYSFTNATDSGFYFDLDLRAVVDGSVVSRFDNNGIEVPDGSRFGPGLSFFGEYNTGLYLDSAGVMAVAIDGGAAVHFTDSGITLPGETWHDVNFQNSWGNYGGGYTHCRYYKDANGFVHLQGLADGTDENNGSTIFTLPAGYRPAGDLIFSQQTEAGARRVDVKSTGDVTYNGASLLGWCSIAGIVFYAG